MANHKSAAKAYLKSLKTNVMNKSRLHRIKTFVGKVEAAIAANDIPKAWEALGTADSEIMKGVSKGVLKLNTAARKVSNLARKIRTFATKVA